MNVLQTTLATSVFVFSLFMTPAVFAVTPTATPMEVAQEEVAPTKVEYALPYPGILPDHPLYFLKRLRDQILEKLIADPVRKIEFYMLQADKNVNMGVFLVAKNNDPVAQETLGGAHKYFDQAISMAGELKLQGKEVPPYLIERFTNAGAKYKEVLTEMNFLKLLEDFSALQSGVEKLKN